MPLAMLDVDSLSNAVDGLVALAAEWRTKLEISAMGPVH